MLSLGNALYWTLDREEEAEPLYREALETALETLGPEHPVYLNAVNNLGCVLFSLGEEEEAERLIRQVIALDCS